MVCAVEIYEKPVLKDPVLIEGLPGIGFVANIATLHLIQELRAKLFGEIRSSAFQDFAVTAQKGEIRFPRNELYYYKGKNEERDLIILHGNTQALTTFGQYELCGRVLDVAEELGCHYIVTLGGLKREEKVDAPKLFCAASDLETLHEALSLDAQIIEGHIFGVAGLLVGLGKLRGMKGFCLLAETLGLYPDATAAQAVLKAVCGMLHLNVDLSRLETAVEATRSILESFGMISDIKEKEMKEDTSHGGLV
jgi:uncharacterized protein (TIGR00162 family)